MSFPRLPVTFAVIALLLAACGDGTTEPTATPQAPGTDESAAAPQEAASERMDSSLPPGKATPEPAPPTPDGQSAGGRIEHVHGLGVDPADGTIYIATHTGLWRSADGASPSRVGQGRQDVMGFSVAGAGRFLGSGHPDPGQSLPPLLGLIRSSDDGQSWQPVSLLGQADFHVLRARKSAVYGYDAASGRLLASRDRGDSWRRRKTPSELLDLAIHPRRPTTIIASGIRAVFGSNNGGRGWQPMPVAPPGLLAWPSAKTIYSVDISGAVWRSRDGGGTFDETGTVGGEPAALTTDQGALLVALHDGTVRRSSNGGRSWRTVVSPG